MNKLLTIGEVYDNLREGQYAISNADIDNQAVLAIDNEGWYYMVPPHRKYKRYSIAMKRDQTLIERRWEIKDQDEFFNTEIETLYFID